MAGVYTIFALVVAYSTGVLTLEDEGIDKQLLDEIIELKHLRDEGYTDFDVSTLHEIDHVTGSLSRTSSNSLHRRRRSLEHGDTPLHFTFTAFHKEFRLTLRYNNDLLRPNTPITIHRQGKTERFTGTIPDCLLYGQTDEYGAVSLSYCDGIGGSVADKEFLYRIDPIGPEDENATETILVSKSHLSAVKDRAYEIPDSQVPKQSNQSERMHDRRYKRQYPAFTVEVGVYMDEIFWAILQNAGETTDKAKINKVAFKWNFVQAMWSISHELGYDVTIQIKRIQIWENNPAWFAPVFTADDLSATMNGFCSAVRSQPNMPNYDHIHLHSGVQDTADGLSFLPGSCVTNRCAVSSDTSFDKAFITGHELGHSFGMRHDTTIGCSVAPADGYMAVSNYPRIGWSSCSKAALHDFVTNNAAGCLDTVNVPDVPQDVADVSLSGLWPGMEMNNDQICESKHGSGWQRREFHLTQSYCGLHSCVNMNEGPDYGIMTTYNLAMYGVYCGEGKVCEKSCITIEESGISRSKMTFTAGDWSDWGPTASCSRECGTGLELKARTCTNPAPLNSLPCEGSAYHGIICNETPCADDPSSTAGVRKARASTVCQRLLDNGLIPSDKYTASGDRRTTSGLGQCEVTCTPVSGHRTSSTYRFALMPDAVTCNADIMTSVEKKGYPRGRRIKSLCVKGQCEVFGCDGQSGLLFADVCGVCGGDHSTCQPVDKIFCGTVPGGERASIVTIPAGASSLQFYFNYGQMLFWFIELFDASDKTLISYFRGVEDTGNTPVSAAGADWHFLYSTQHLYTFGTITEDVILKFYNYNSDAGTNTCLHVGFSLPLDVPIPTFISGTEDDPGDTSTGTGGTGTGTGGTGTGTGGTGTGTGGTGTGTGGTGTGTGGTGTGTGGGTSTGVPADRCSPGSFHCTTLDTCFSYEELCDNIDNCGDMTDESSALCQSAAQHVSSGLLVPLLAAIICLMSKRVVLL